MILSSSELNIQIHYDENVAGPGYDPTLIPPMNYHIVVSMYITKEMLSFPLFIAVLHNFTPDGGNLYSIYLKDGVRLESEDKTLMEKLLMIFSTEFEGITLREKHPELFL